MKKLFLILLILPALACSILNQTSGASRPEPTAIQSRTRGILNFSPTAAACQVKTGFDAGRLNFRSGPGIAFKSITILREGDPITILDKPADNGWLYVEAHSLQGWVNPNFIKCEKVKNVIHK